MPFGAALSRSEPASGLLMLAWFELRVEVRPHSVADENSLDLLLNFELT